LFVGSLIWVLGFSRSPAQSGPDATKPPASQKQKGLSDRPIQAVLDVVRQREKSRERLTGKVEPVRRYAIVASRWAPDGDDDDSLDKWRGMAFRIEPIFYFNGPGENHEDLPKVTGHLSKLVLGA